MNRWGEALLVFVLMLPVLWLFRQDKERTFGEALRETPAMIGDLLGGLF